MAFTCQTCGSASLGLPLFRTSPDPQNPDWQCRPCLEAKHELGRLTPTVARMAGLINPAPTYASPESIRR